MAKSRVHTPTPAQERANERLRQRLAAPGQHLTITDELGLTSWRPPAAALYQLTEERPARCPRCLRAFDPYGETNRRSTYCSETCRWAMGDERRTDDQGEWVRCPECDADSLAFDSRRVLCAPPSPARYCDPSPCTAAHQRRLAARAAKAYRDRRAEVERRQAALAAA